MRKTIIICVAEEATVNIIARVPDVNCHTVPRSVSVGMFLEDHCNGVVSIIANNCNASVPRGNLEQPCCLATTQPHIAFMWFFSLEETARKFFVLFLSLNVPY
jgi:hypothetical protein